MITGRGKIRAPIFFKQGLTVSVYCDKLTLVYHDRPKEIKAMNYFELGAIQERFADIVWANEPIASGDLVKICEKELEWKKSTTYTVLRKLCDKGLLKNEDGIVTSVISKERFYSAKSKQIVDDSYAGSLPAFIAAFISDKKLTSKEAEEIQQMIDAFKNK